MSKKIDNTQQNNNNNSQKTENGFVMWTKETWTKKKSEWHYLYVEDVKNTMRKPKLTLISILLGFLIGVIVVAILGQNPLDLIYSLFRGAFRDGLAFSNFLAELTWLLPLGLAMVVSFRSGMFNIGAAGQMMFGGMIAYIVAFEMPAFAGGWIVPLIMAIISAMALGLIIGFLKTKFGINEVVSSIMFNWIIFWLYAYLQANSQWMRPPTGGHIGFIPLSGDQLKNTLQASWAINSFGSNTRLNNGIFLSSIALLAVWFFYKYTSSGFKSDIIGKNINAGRYSGYNEKQIRIKSLMMSAGLAGLAGMVFYLGRNNVLTTVGDDLPGYGFNGITIALIGWNSPMGALGGSIFLGLITSMQTTLTIYMDASIGDVITSIIIILISISQFMIVYDPIGKYKAKKKLRLKEGGN